MGYTHYFSYKGFQQSNVKVIVNELKTFKDNFFNNQIKSGSGKGKPVINLNKISINGDESLNQDHETFFIDFKNEVSFDFCKTARKDYDGFVCICLLSLANHNENFSFSSDGNIEDWIDFIELYLKNTTTISDNLKNILKNKFEYIVK